ncbi:hypothetical protein ACJMK2_041553 [Sinanodonta woodiana]|uniref:Dynein axonemal intermediate chain 4 n=1 Tax=Sinanodonta woodiana TaxID=1069815 RepID=A0ABD3W7H8_SINWO
MFSFPSEYPQSLGSRSKMIFVASQATGASTASRKSVTASVMKSKYGGGTTFGSSRSNLLSSASRTRSVGPGGQPPDKVPLKNLVKVLDELGNDVTPLPFYQVDPNQVKKNQSNILGDSSGGTPTDLMSQASLYGAGTVTASTFGGGPFTRSVFSQSYDTGSESMVGDVEEQPTDMALAWGEIRHKREDVKEELTDADLEKMVEMTLIETDTIWLLDMPAVCISTESDEAAAVKASNERYMEIVKNKAGNDRYAERGMNTFNEPPKFKLVQTTKIGYNEVGINATTWDMYDTYEQIEKEKKGYTSERKKSVVETSMVQNDGDDEEGTISRPTSPKEAEEGGDKIGQIAISKEPGQILRESSVVTVRIESRATFTSSVAGSESVFASKETGVSAITVEQSSIDEEKILNTENFRRDLFVMERVINLNTYQPQQACYRGYEVIPDIDKAAQTQQLAVSGTEPNFDRLWAYVCPLTKGRNVSSIAWNKSNPDLFAIGYGQFEFSNQKEGLVCCWSLKNPEYPERVYTFREGVTSVDFARVNPNLLAVGLYDGGVAVYNVRNTKDEPIVDNFYLPGKHTAPVWQIKWIEKERGTGEETTEVLVSISTDGRVTQWSIRKGFESYDLMRLKRMPTRMGGKKEKKGEAFISRFAGGTCFDFHTRDSNLYLAGTEEGHIHKCSCSYNEQYLESYLGHTGPVYKIQWSPFVNDIFLSGSADWSIRLWHQDHSRPVLNFFSSTKAVYDVTWSPRSSTVFACVNEGGVEVWDLSWSTLDPRIVHTLPSSHAKMTSVAFAKNSECLLVGDSEGQVTVLQLLSMPKPPDPDKQASTLTNVIKSCLASQLPHKTTDTIVKEDEGLEDDLPEV